MSKIEERIKWLEEQMKIQEDAIMIAKTIQAIQIHGYLLNKLTQEWCELNKQLN